MIYNVFKVLGFNKEKSADLNLRVRLIDAIIEVTKIHSYSQKELQLILGQKQPEISYLLSGKISKFSSEKLLRFLSLLGAKVEIKTVLPKKKIAL